MLHNPAQYIEFRESISIGNWWNILVDNTETGWIWENDSLFEVLIWLNQREIAFLGIYGSFSTAKTAVYKYYGEDVFDRITEVEM